MNTITPLFNIGPRISAAVLGSPYSQYRAATAFLPISAANL